MFRELTEAEEFEAQEWAERTRELPNEETDRALGAWITSPERLAAYFRYSALDYILRATAPPKRSLEEYAARFRQALAEEEAAKR